MPNNIYSKLATILLLAGLSFTSPAALSMAPGNFLTDASQKYYDICAPAGSSTLKKLNCSASAIFVDPIAIDIDHIVFSLRYDTSKYYFNELESGPLGQLSIDGDAPPVNPGIGTENIEVLPISGFSPGAPLAGSVLKYTDIQGLLTVDYLLQDPITITEPLNFFRLTFNWFNPMTIDLDASTVTYLSTGQGSDFSSAGFSCTGLGSQANCMSEHPVSGMTVTHNAPEPATWGLMVSGMALLALFTHRNRKAKFEKK